MPSPVSPTEADLPVPEPDLMTLRAELDDHRGRIEEAGGLHVLVVRSPKEEPDVVADLEDALLYLDEDDADAADLVLLVGSEAVLRVDRRVLAQKVEARRAEDERLLKTAGGHLTEPYDYTVLRGGERGDVLRLFVRIPKTYARDLSHEDLVHLRANLGPLSDTPKGRAVAAVYLLAREDHARLDAARFFADLEATARRSVKERDVPATLLSRLKGRGYSVLQGIDATQVDVAAEKGDHTVLARVAGAVDETDVERFLRVADQMGADVFVAVTAEATEAARRRALGSPVELVRPEDVGELPL